MDNLPNNKFCILPWISLEATPLGSVRPCCLADDEITKPNGEKFNLSHDSLSEIRNSDYMKDLRNQFLSGGYPKTCRKCWDEEKVNRTSKRMNTLSRIGNLVKDATDWSVDAKPLMFLDLKLGNICNLKCRICGSWSSSTFAAEEIKFSNDPIHREFNKMGQWPRKTTTFWKELDKISSDIKYLEFTGGEPFMIKEHFEFLKQLISQGISTTIEIHYNTNGTIAPTQEMKDIWKNFKHVEIAFSIDNTGIRFEYERTNAKWNEVNNNITEYIQLREEMKNVSLQLCTTINIYNVLYLHDILNWKHYKDFDFIFWNMLHDAKHNCIKSLPPNAKNEVKRVLSNTNSEFDKVIEFMFSGEGVLRDELLHQIEILDNRRQHSLENTHPELFKLIYS